MAEAIEPRFSVIASHSAGSEAAKRHFAGGEMNDRIVDTAAAETTFIHYEIGRFLVRGKDIQGQRRRARIDFPDYRFEAFKRQYGHDWAKNFLLHRLVRPGNAVQHGRLDFQRRLVPAPAVNYFFRFDERRNPLEMLTADDPAVRGVL